MQLSHRLPPAVPIGIISNSTPKEQKFRMIYDCLRKFGRVFAETLPARHGTTHTGGTDSVMGSGLPSSITPGEEGSHGNNESGSAPMDHVHDATALAGFADLAEVTTDPMAGAAVYDNQNRRLLEDILVVLHDIEEELRGRV